MMEIGVIGAGAMGRGIAQVCAAAGCEVRLFDSKPSAVEAACAAIHKDLAQAVARGKLDPARLEAAMARIHPADALEAFADCDLVVEAIVEQLEAKRALMQALEAVVRPTCILVSNTSSLSVTAIAAACRLPDRVAGWHFFNPVPRMKLVEVVQAPRTDASVVQALVELSRRVGHRAIVTADSPGFVVNHGGRAFVTEGLKMLAERAAEHPVLDAILRNAGFRMGPFELLDLTALDVSVPVMESIHAQYYGDDRYRPVALANTRLRAGLLGRKTGQGFYDYRSDAVTPVLPPQPAAPDRLPMVWWPLDGPAGLPAAVTDLLPADTVRCERAEADVTLIAPLGSDLSTAVTDGGFDPARTVAVDPMFSAATGATLMTSPATCPEALVAARGLFAAAGVPTYVTADSPGYVAPRVVACIVNLACEMAQQGVASPEDIDIALKLGLGYPAGPFEWGDRLGADRVLAVLEGLYATFGDPRYRPAPWLVRRARLGLPLSSPDHRPQ